MPQHLVRAWRAGVILAAGILPSALAMWAMPSPAPVSRLVANVAAYVKEHPTDPEGHYILGRIHGLAFVLTTKEINVWDRQWDASSNPHLPNIATQDWQAFRGWPQPAGTPPTRAELAVHLTEAVRHAGEAIRLGQGGPSLYHLSLAFILDTGMAMASEVEVLPSESPALSEQRRAQLQVLVDRLAEDASRADAIDGLRESLAEAGPLLLPRRVSEVEPVREAVRVLLRELWRREAVDSYYRAFAGAIMRDSAIKEQPMRGLDTLISYEAGTSYLRLVRDYPPRDNQEEARTAEVTRGVAQLEAKPHNNAVTPIIFSLQHPAELDELLDPAAAARFDLDGDGHKELWPWVRPDTGFLVWDPCDDRRVTSGRDLFGSVTWWMFFSNGYRALDALDDNRDRWLTGSELIGLSVWFDRDSDGVSTSDEVAPVLSLGIAAIAAFETSRVGDAPANRLGLRMTDGRVLPTYDWVASSLEPAAAR